MKKSKRRIFALFFVLYTAVFIGMILTGSSISRAMIAMLLLSIISYFIPKYRSKKKNEEIRKSYDMDMPDLLINVAMMMESGMNIWDAITQCVRRENKKRPLYAALDKAISSVHQGLCQDYCQALGRMAEECKATSVSNFVSLVVQNAQKGNNRITEILFNSASFYRNERKATATKLAEEATTLMLLPSAMMLVAIILMMVAPAAMKMIGGL